MEYGGISGSRAPPSRHVRIDAMMTSQTLRTLLQGVTSARQEPVGSPARAPYPYARGKGTHRTFWLVKTASKEFFATPDEETERMAAYLRRLTEPIGSRRMRRKLPMRATGRPQCRTAGSVPKATVAPSPESFSSKLS